MERLALFVLHHRKRVMLAWLFVFVAGMVGAGSVSKQLTTDFSLPDQPGYEADQAIVAKYSNGGLNSPLIVTATSTGDITAQVQAVHDLVTGAAADAAEVPVATSTQTGRPEYGFGGPVRLRVVDYVSSGKDPAFLTKDGKTTWAMVQVPLTNGFTKGIEVPFEEALNKRAAATDLKVGLTGYNLLALPDDTAESPSLLIETLLGAVGALAVLAFVFASFLALVPLLVAAVSILTTFLVLLALTTFADVSFIVQFLVSLVGLGVAIDYSLLLVTRWREEREHGHSNEEAVVIACKTAGHAVVSSAITVAISLVALVLIPAPFLRSIGYGGMLIPLVSTLVVLTLLPALLGGIGPRVDWPRLRHENTASKAWTSWTRKVVRFRWPVAVLALTAMVALALPLLSIQIGSPRTEALASSGQRVEALGVLKDGGLPTGITTPIEVLVSSTADVDAIVAKAKAVPGVLTAFAPSDWTADGTRVVEVLPIRETVDNNTVKVVGQVSDALDSEAGVLGVTGQGAFVTDYITAVYDSFPLVLTVICLMSFILLARTFRSLLLAAKAVLLNMLSVAATFGGVVLFWQLGYGSDEVFGIESTGAITFWLPLMIFAFLFGLSMDYEVFILARTREEYDRLGVTDEAVVQGLGRTGRLVTSAALILFLSFMALASSPGTDIKMFASALGFGILLDATVVRALLVPALVSLFGDYNWYLPPWAAKVLRVEPSAAGPRFEDFDLPEPEPALTD